MIRWHKCLPEEDRERNLYQASTHNYSLLFQNQLFWIKSQSRCSHSSRHLWNDQGQCCHSTTSNSQNLWLLNLRQVYNHCMRSHHWKHRLPWYIGHHDTPRSRLRHSWMWSHSDLYTTRPCKVQYGRLSICVRTINKDQLALPTRRYLQPKQRLVP